jgi:ribosomal protein S18 acetylase RimI-like enzyme
MNKVPVRIISCDFENAVHCSALVNLMNEYITDKMGGGDPYSEDQKLRLIEGLKSHPAKLIYFAVTDNEFIGLITCFVNFSTFTVKPFINIHDVIVTNTWRNSGIGRQMIDRVVETAREMDCAKVTLEVRADNQNARHLYQSMGFKDAEPRQYYWSKYL